MAAAQPERQVEAVGSGVDVAGGREYHARVRDEEGAVELGQLLDGLPHVGVLYLLVLVGVSLQRVEDQGFGPFHDLGRVADDEERPDLSTLTTLAGDLDRQRDGLFEHLRVYVVLYGADLLVHLRLSHRDQPPFSLASTGNRTWKRVSPSLDRTRISPLWSSTTTR